MYCTQCGNAISDSDKFCSKCGNAIPGPVADHVTIAPAQKDSPPVTSASPTAPFAEDSVADPVFLKSFANRLAVSIWWKTAVALLIPGLVVVAAGTGDVPQKGGIALIVIFSVIFYFLITAYVPYQTLRSLIGKRETDPSRNVGTVFGDSPVVMADIRVGSIEIHPAPAANSDYIALTWGFVWRLTVVSVLLALPFQLSGYAPDDLERLLVSLVMLMLACWLASLWLVFTPYGKCRFQTVLIESDEG